MAIRDTQQILEVFRSASASNSNIRNTQLVLEVFRLDPTFGLNIGDSFTLTDNVEIELPLAVISLNVDVDDWLSKTPFKGNPNNLKDSWKDGLEFFIDGVDPELFISIEDLAAFADDELVIGIGLIFTDDLDLWGDSATVAQGLLLKAFDSMFFNIFDAVVISILLSQIAADDALNLSDAVETSLNEAVNEIGDQFVLSDEINFLMAGFKNFGDTLTLSDAIGLELKSTNAFADDLDNWGDAVSINNVTPLTLSIADDLDNYSDSLESLTGGADLSYLRRYLNDVLQ